MGEYVDKGWLVWRTALSPTKANLLLEYGVESKVSAAVEQTYITWCKLRDGMH